MSWASSEPSALIWWTTSCTWTGRDADPQRRALGAPASRDGRPEAAVWRAAAGRGESHRAEGNRDQGHSSQAAPHSWIGPRRRRSLGRDRPNILSPNRERNPQARGARLTYPLYNGGRRPPPERHARPTRSRDARRLERPAPDVSHPLDRVAHASARRAPAARRGGGGAARRDAAGNGGRHRAGDPARPQGRPDADPPAPQLRGAAARRGRDRRAAGCPRCSSRRPPSSRWWSSRSTR